MNDYGALNKVAYKSEPQFHELKQIKKGSSLVLKRNGVGNQVPNYRSDLAQNFKRFSPELKNQNHGNQADGTEARGMVYALGGGETNQDFDDMEDDINA
ncbi:hypothetical protein Tco_0869200 [Tanacetum coccineum]